MKLTSAQLLHVQTLQARIGREQEELARFLNYVLAEHGADLSKQYTLVGTELKEQNPVKLQ